MSSNQVPSGYNTPIPEKITTPDVVDSRIGMLNFTDGVPTAETAETLFDHLDFLRGVEAFLNCIPAASMEALRLGFGEVGVDAINKVAISDRLLDPDSLFLTGNADTVYVSGFFDLEESGPVVVEVPPGSGPGTVNDAWFRFVIDMGPPGPDRGEGGKYLILPPGYEGDVPDGYFVAESRSNSNWLILRGFLVDGKPDAAVKMFTEGLRMYALADADDPAEMEFISFSGTQFNTIHANDYGFYEEIAPVIHREPIDLIDTETRGLLASIGIHKDKPFNPDDRMKRLLVEAAEVANATARAIYFHLRDPSAYNWEDRYWHTFFLRDEYRWLFDEGRGGTYADARAMFFYVATVNTPAMAWKLIAKGSQYAGIDLDADGDFLDGSRSYRLHIPPDVPAQNFWSMCVYDPQTRSMLQTGQKFPSRNNVSGDLEPNEDGSFDLSFGPEPPADKQGNWIQTVPEKGWFAIIRMYGPLEPWYDGTWRPGNIEKLN